MPILDGSNPPLGQQEKKIRQLSSKDIGGLLRVGKQVYRLSAKIFNLLPVNWKPRNNQDLVLLILLLRAMENSRAIEILIRSGYFPAAASLAANQIEVFTQARYIAQKATRAEKWLNHTANSSVWHTTGKDGLCTKLLLPDLERRYRELCSIKHTQSKSINLNYDSDGSKFTLYGSPIWEPAIAKQIVGYGLTSLGETAYHCSDILSGVLDPKDLEKWRKAFGTMTERLKVFYVE